MNYQHPWVQRTDHSQVFFEEHDSIQGELHKLLFPLHMTSYHEELTIMFPSASKFIVTLELETVIISPFAVTISYFKTCSAPVPWRGSVPRGFTQPPRRQPPTPTSMHWPWIRVNWYELEESVVYICVGFLWVFINEYNSILSYWKIHNIVKVFDESHVLVENVVHKLPYNYTGVKLRRYTLGFQIRNFELKLRTRIEQSIPCC